MKNNNDDIKGVMKDMALQITSGKIIEGNGVANAAINHSQKSFRSFGSNRRLQKLPLGGINQKTTVIQKLGDRKRSEGLSEHEKQKA